MQLHLYDLVAVRKQQLGTSQALRRTQRTALNADATLLASPLPSPKKLMEPKLGKENTGCASAIGSDPVLVLPVHAGQGKTTVASAHRKGQGEAEDACFRSESWTSAALLLLQHGVEQIHGIE